MAIPRKKIVQKNAKEVSRDVDFQKESISELGDDNQPISEEVETEHQQEENTGKIQEEPVAKTSPVNEEQEAKGKTEDNAPLTVKNDHLLLASLRPAKAKSVAKGGGKAGAASVVNTEKNGKRFTISNEVIEWLENPNTVQMGFRDQDIIVGSYLGEDFTNYVLKKDGKKGVVYAAELVAEIVELLDLDFSDRTSVTLYSVVYEMIGEEPIVIISI